MSNENVFRISHHPEWLRHDPTSMSGVAPGEPAADRILFVCTGQLAALDAPLRLKYGPIAVTLETWSDGVVQARWPEAALHGEGENDALALDALRERIQEFVREVLQAGPERVDGPLLRHWRAVEGMVEISLPERATP